MSSYLPAGDRWIWPLWLGPEDLGISQPLASQHLRVLKDAGLVAGRRESYWTLYRLLPARLELVREGTELLIGSVRKPRGRSSRRWRSRSPERGFILPMWKNDRPTQRCRRRPSAGGEIGALLRREGLYSSHLVAWRRQRYEGRLDGRARGRRGKDSKDVEIEQLRRENSHLQRRLEQAHTVIDVPKNSRGRLGSSRRRQRKTRRDDRGDRGARPRARDEGRLLGDGSLPRHGLPQASTGAAGAQGQAGALDACPQPPFRHPATVVDDGRRDTHDPLRAGRRGHKEMEMEFFPHFCRGHIAVAFVFSVPGAEEKDDGKPVAGDTGENLELALCHLHLAQPTLFPSLHRYDYRITNAISTPMAVAFGDNAPEARDSEIKDPDNVRRVLREVEGCNPVILSGKKAGLLAQCIRESGKAVAEVCHVGNKALGGKYKVSDRSSLARRMHRAQLWADEVLRAIAGEDA